MEIKELKERPSLVEHNRQAAKQLHQYKHLLNQLSKQALSAAMANAINTEVERINALPDAHKDLAKEMKNSQSGLLKTMERKYKLVPKNHYRNTWLALGMAAFGIPLGVAFGASLGNMGLIGIGIPVGMAIGLGIGSGMDKKAFESGRQIDFELKH